MQLFLVIVLFLPNFSTVFTLRQIFSDQGHEYTYIFTYPQAMIAGSIVKSCLTLYNFNLPVNLSVKFVRNRCSSLSQTGCNNNFKITEEHQCVNLEVPVLNGGIIYDELQIDIQGERRRIIKKGRKDVYIFSKREVIYVETDRTVYKPEEEIKIRLLALQFSLRPVEIPKIAKVTLLGPNQMKVKQWPNLTIATGIVELSYKLQEQAPSGIWKLEVNGLIKASFEVNGYVLPRFKTKLEHPGYFFWGDAAISIGLCSVYTYNEPVCGTGTIEAVVRNSDGKENTPVTTTSTLVNGCIKMELLLNKLKVHDGLYHTVEITGKVIEFGTNSTVTKTSSMPINSLPYEMTKAIYKLKPGLPFSGQLYIRDKNVKAIEQNMTICYVHREFSNPHTSCKSVVNKNQNVVPFTIPPLKKVWNKVTVEAYVQSFDDEKYYSRPKIYLRPFYSISNNSLLIMPLSKNKWKCGDTLSFKIMYTLKNITETEILFNYKLLSRYDLITAGVKLVKPEKFQFDPTKFENVIEGTDDNLQDLDSYYSYFTIDVNLDDGVYTDVKFLVFYVTKGEVIADDISVSIEKCLPNKVDIEWIKNEILPNERARLQISSTQGSFCVLSATNIANSFMSPLNRLTPQDILLPFEIFNVEYFPNTGKNCLIPQDFDSNQNVIWFNGIHKDAYTIFSENKLGVITNLLILTKPCNYLVVDTQRTYQSEVRRIRDEFDDDYPDDTQNLIQKATQKNSIRSYFPQTWLWDTIVLSEPKMFYEVNVPGTITRWETNVLCLNRNGGVGISKPTELVVKKPFFMEVLSPDFVKRNIDPVHMSIIVHNRFNHSIPVVITFIPNNFTKKFEDDPNKAVYCIEPEKTIVHEFIFTGTKVGMISVTLTAQIVYGSIKNCGNEKKFNGLDDVVIKQIKVVPEAYGEHVLKSALICAGDWGKPDNVGWQLSTPEDQMILNVEAGLSIDSNILSPLINNLQLWIREPLGTVDEIISAVVTNIYALHYVKLDEKNNNNTLLIDKAIKNLHSGSQRLYRFFHNDGLFEKNKNSDTLNSIFTTAFIVKLFGLMKHYIPINKPILTRAVAGLMVHQQSNGCFDIVTDEIETPTISLTSFVIITLIETSSEFSNQQKQLAKECISKQIVDLDTSDLAISTYALSLMNNDQEAASNLENLISKAERFDNAMYWNRKRTKWSKKVGVDVQIAGYVLMSLMKNSNISKNVDYARYIVRWLLSDPQQGHYTTLDIVVILEGITKFMDFVNSRRSNLTLSISTTSNGEIKFNVRPGIEHLTEIVDIYNVPDYVQVTGSGTGCVFVKSSLEFSKYTSYLNLNAHSKIQNQCKCTIEFTTCISTNSTKESLIAVLKIGIPPGFAVDESSLLSLDKQVTGLQKYMYADRLVLLHFSGITRKEKCAQFILQETVEAKQRTKITVKMFNYYASDAVMKHSYLLPSCKYPDEIEAKI